MKNFQVSSCHLPRFFFHLCEESCLIFLNRETRRIGQLIAWWCITVGCHVKKVHGTRWAEVRSGRVLEWPGIGQGLNLGRATNTGAAAHVELMCSALKVALLQRLSRAGWGWNSVGMVPVFAEDGQEYQWCPLHFWSFFLQDSGIYVMLVVRSWTAASWLCGRELSLNKLFC